jgi:hypothetical protein
MDLNVTLSINLSRHKLVLIVSSLILVLSIIMPRVIMLSVIIPNVTMTIVIMLNAVAPLEDYEH